MSTIRCVYHPVNGKATEPDWPATAQHPDAVRYLVGLYYVDAIGGKPTAQDVDAVLNPPAALSQAEQFVDAMLADPAALAKLKDAVIEP